MCVCADMVYNLVCNFAMWRVCICVYEHVLYVAGGYCVRMCV